MSRVKENNELFFEMEKVASEMTFESSTIALLHDISVSLAVIADSMSSSVCQKDYERATEQMEHDALYELTFNPDDGSV